MSIKDTAKNAAKMALAEKMRRAFIKALSIDGIMSRLSACESAKARAFEVFR